MYYKRVYEDNIDRNRYADEEYDNYEFGGMTMDDLESTKSTNDIQQEERSDVTDVFHGGMEIQADNAGLV